MVVEVATNRFFMFWTVSFFFFLISFRIVNHCEKTLDIDYSANVLEELYGKVCAGVGDQLFWRSVLEYPFVKSNIDNSATALGCSGTDRSAL